MSVDRLTRTFPSADDYVAAIRQAPYVDGFWDATIESYYRAEIETASDGTAHARTSASAIAQVLEALPGEPWSEYVKQIKVPSILINGPAPFGPAGAPPIVSADLARSTASAIEGCQYVEVPGNHLTMVFGANAPHVVRVISDFMAQDVAAAT